MGASVDRRTLRLTMPAMGLALTACATATTYHDFKPSDVQSGEGVAIGRVHIRFSDDAPPSRNKDCSICFAGGTPATSQEQGRAPGNRCQHLEPEGFLFMALAQGPARMESI